MITVFSTKNGAIREDDAALQFVRYRLLDDEELLELTDDADELWLLVESLEDDVLLADEDVVLALDTGVLLAADVLMLLALVETLEAEELLDDLLALGVPSMRAIFLQLSVSVAPESFSA